MKQASWFRTIKLMYTRFSERDMTALGAQMAYYWILALFPLLLFLLAFLSFLNLSEQQFLDSFLPLLPESTAATVSSILQEATENKSQTMLSIGMLTTIWAASNGVNAIIKGLNKAFDVKENRPFWKVRGLSVLLTLGLAITILLAIGVLVFGRRISTIAHNYSDVVEILWSPAAYVVPLLAILLVFIAIYYFAPNCRHRLRDTFPGALFTTIGWVATSLIFSIYVNNFSNYSATYGSIGGIIALLVWLYISSIIILVGGELNAVLLHVRKADKKR